MTLYDAFYRLSDWGVFDVLLPFVLIFTIVFAVLQKVKIFGDPYDATKGRQARGFNTVIALVMGMAVIVPHVLGLYPPGGDIVLIMNQSIPNVSIVIVAIVMGLILIGVMGRRFELVGNSVSGWIALAAFALVIIIFGSAANWWDLPLFHYVIADPDIMALVVVILVFAIIIWFVTKEDNNPNKGKFMKDLGAHLQELK